jgi:hypothetical protein
LCSKPNERLAVVYLSRHADGLEAVRQFVRSYQDHEAGVDHHLVVIFKGYPSLQERESAQAVFAGVAHHAIEMEDAGFDIGAYFRAAREIRHSMVCFLNTHTQIAADGWLAALHDHATKPRAGVAAAMGSFESLSSSMELVQAAQRHYAAKPLMRDPVLMRYYGFMPWVNRHPSVYLAYRWLQKPFRAVFPAYDYSAQLLRFPLFPNPHVRTNGFMIERERFLETSTSVLRSKWDAYAFESGADSLTARLRRGGLSTVVVDRNARAYEIDQWWHSETFRSGEQRGLLLTDNQTRNFAAMLSAHRTTLVRMTWGDYLEPAPADFPDFGVRFMRDRGIVPEGLSVAAGAVQAIPRPSARNPYKRAAS